MKVLLVDDHQVLRDGMRQLVAQARAADGRAPTSIFEVSTFAEALKVADENPDLDLVLLDLHLPDVTGFAALNDLQERHPEIPVVIMSAADDADTIQEAIELGAMGFIPKSFPSRSIVNALNLVLAGSVFVPREAISGPRKSSPPPRAPQPADPATKALALGFTPRQADVLALILAGKSNKLICRELNLAEGTVKSHVAAVFRILNVSTRVQAVVEAAKLGLAGDPPAR